MRKMCRQNSSNAPKFPIGKTNGVLCLLAPSSGQPCSLSSLQLRPDYQWWTLGEKTVSQEIWHMVGLHLRVRHWVLCLPQLVLVSLALPLVPWYHSPGPVGPGCGIQCSFKASIPRVQLEVDGSEAWEVGTGLLWDNTHSHQLLKRRHIGIRLRAYIHLQDAETYTVESTYVVLF